MAQWKISGRQSACSKCSHPFEDGERHNSMVSFTEEEVRRGDFCQSCWEKGDIDVHWDEVEQGEGEAIAAPVEPHRFWWSTTHHSKPQKTLQMDMDALQRLFLELEKRQETKLRELRYVLCLLLMRKKRVKLERILRDESGESF
ncbi:MAG: hypothetical protein KDB61_15865, partial [Planctomycetes bacterium]|nr:hypothetical protein [Planctomycetota bacterium]